MSILVTGGAGYIGSHAVIDLLGAGEEVVILDNLSTGFDWAVQDAATLHVGDIADTDLLDGILRDHAVEAVIHFAGSIVVPESVSDPLKYYLNNTAKSRTLIERCVANGVRHFIFSSTAAVYGMLDISPATEDAALKPMSPYGRSKLMTEWMLQDVAAAHDMTYAALRYFNVAGADPKGRVGQSTANATHLIKVACQTALGQRSHIEVFGDDYPTPDGTCIRDYIHVSDLAAAHTAALHYLRKGGDSLVANCGYGHGFSVRDVLGAVERAAGHSFEVRQAPRRPGDPASIVSDPSLIKRTLGWQPAHDELDKIVAHALAWEKRLGERNR
ncbi:UDP-glucose 4-epimerase GalE [Parvibaculum sp.]|jgi:UDP-glucose 4-epimerase|uniref:UDP-glucose 4-epimerase GalE n=1 Tax=Parvibaculum sp. TaxID=2024848 RepID=UPI000C5C8D9D|nr:UDP-glucose 4-epimerase GalE [Parvibaculum sp.]MAM93638.1 UDP-glucose 4-epimerase GalE [Parvibaculum sp.]|tara:strand:+ start:23433 stop:24419 length:987 start_codon:yes stop_codon:yes gene_type:complete